MQCTLLKPVLFLREIIAVISFAGDANKNVTN